MMPAGEPLIIQVQYVSTDGSVEDGPRISVPGAGGSRVGKEPRTTVSSWLPIMPINAADWTYPPTSEWSRSAAIEWQAETELHSAATFGV